MFRRTLRGNRRDDSGAHNDRPWVYFMIDSFFLVTQFFVLTFQMKTPDDLVLPNKLPVSEGGFPTPCVLVESVAVRIRRETAHSEALYSINGGETLNLAGLSEKFGKMASGRSPDRFRVRVSYGAKVNFGDIMPIFNTCAKLRIKQCGL